MTPEEIENLAREALLRCINKPLWLEAYQPEIVVAIRAAIAAERERCARVAESPFGPGLADRDDYWQPRIAAAIRALE